MEIYWYGQAFFKLKGKNATVSIDPFDPDFTGLKLPKDLSSDIVLKTHDHQDHSNISAIEGYGGLRVFAGPGEYESKGVVIFGISTFHDKSEGKERGLNTVYNIWIDGLNIVHLGDLGQAKLTDQQVQEIDKTDILLIPVGSIFTIDAKEAAEIVSQLEPRIIIPMHYGIPGLKFPLDGVDKFLKEMGSEGISAQPKLSVTKDKLPDEPQVILLSKNA